MRAGECTPNNMSDELVGIEYELSLGMSRNNFVRRGVLEGTTAKSGDVNKLPPGPASLHTDRTTGSRVRYDGATGVLADGNLIQIGRNKMFWLKAISDALQLG